MMMLYKPKMQEGNKKKKKKKRKKNQSIMLNTEKRAQYKEKSSIQRKEQVWVRLISDISFAIMPFP